MRLVYAAVSSGQDEYTVGGLFDSWSDAFGAAGMYDEKGLAREPRGSHGVYPSVETFVVLAPYEKLTGEMVAEAEAANRAAYDSWQFDLALRKYGEGKPMSKAERDLLGLRLPKEATGAR